jgi:hypothetical protein
LSQKFLFSQQVLKVLSGNTTTVQATKVVLKLMDLLGHPHPPYPFLRAFCHPSIFSIFVESLWQQLRPNRAKNREADALTKAFFRSRPKGILVKGRVLGPLGSYPNTIIEFDTVQYVPLHSVPLLITMEKTDPENHIEIGYLSKWELIAATVINLAGLSPGFHFYFQSGNARTIARESLEGLSFAERQTIFYELLSLNIKPHRAKNIFQPCTSTLSTVQYSFTPFTFYKEAMALYAAFKPTDHLLLRTAFMLQKARMLFFNQVFFEDAVANVFFSLEGCLLLLQRKYGGSDTKIDLKLLTELFNQRFNNGPELFEFIKEAYEKRVEIVHPSPRSGANWQPYLVPDDYYEY